MKNYLDFDRRAMKRFLDRAQSLSQNETETNAKMEEFRIDLNRI